MYDAQFAGFECQAGVFAFVKVDTHGREADHYTSPKPACLVWFKCVQRPCACQRGCGTHLPHSMGPAHAEHCPCAKACLLAVCSIYTRRPAAAAALHPSHAQAWAHCCRLGCWRVSSRLGCHHHHHSNVHIRSCAHVCCDAAMCVRVIKPTLLCV